MKWSPDLQPQYQSDQRTWMEWLVRNFAKLSRWTASIPEAETVTYGATITFNAGDGTPEGDLNATDFTGHPYATGTALQILSNAIVTFGHNAIAYLWTGPSGVTVGLGGNYTAVAGNLTPVGTADHTILVNRDQADQHPTSAITSLDNDQAVQDAAISANANNLANHIANTSNPHQVTHAQLPDVDPDPQDPHQQYQKKLPIMVLGGTVDSFTLNTTDSKLVNYTLSGEGNTSGSFDAAAGEITIPETGVYSLVANVLGLQGNDTKEEWIELKLDVDVVDPERYTIGFADVTTDKTTTRQAQSSVSREFTSGQVLSLYMWASAGLGTFTVVGVTFELHKLMEPSQYT